MVEINSLNSVLVVLGVVQELESAEVKLAIEAFAAKQIKKPILNRSIPRRNEGRGIEDLGLPLPEGLKVVEDAGVECAGKVSGGDGEVLLGDGGDAAIGEGGGDLRRRHLRAVEGRRHLFRLLSLSLFRPRSLKWFSRSSFEAPGGPNLVRPVKQSGLAAQYDLKNLFRFS